MKPSEPQGGDVMDSSARERRRQKLQRIAIAAAAVVLLVEGYIAVFKRENDFIFHRNLGEAFLRGEPYGNSGDWYPLPRVMFDALIAAPPLRVARGVSLLAAIAALGWIAAKWHALAEQRSPLARSRWFAASAVAFFVLLPYVLRDMDECGLQIFLLTLLTAGGWALARGRSVQAGFWLATAAVYKATPLLCLPYLLWKRRWKAAAAMVAFVGFWAVAPAAFLGWDKTVAAHQQFLARNRIVAAHRTAYPELPDFEPPKPQNQSLHAAVARYLETYPPGHPLNLEPHPLFHQFGSLDGETAYRVVRGAILALGLVLAWRFRRSGTGPHGVSDFPAEWAAVCMLCALAAPLCWKQHLIVALPAALLVARTAVSDDPSARRRLAALACIAVALVLTRHSIVGRETSVVFLSYKVDTMLMLGLLTMALTTPTAAARSSTTVSRLDDDLPVDAPQPFGRAA